MKTMIFAAGMGTRLKPLTDYVPKALIPVDDKPLLQHTLEHVATDHDDHVVINVHHHAQQIINYISVSRANWPASIKISEEQELLETGGGIRKAAPLFCTGDADFDSLPILIHNVDIITNIHPRELYAQHQAEDHATLIVSMRKTARYLIFDAEMKLVGWTNITTGEIRSPYPEIMALNGTKLSMSFEHNGHKYQLFAFSGIHIFSPTLFSEMDKWPERFPIMDFYLNVCAKFAIRGIVRQDLTVLDVGKIDILSKLADR